MTLDLATMPIEPRFFIIGTKYARAHDKLPLMVSHGVISTGFVDEFDLSPFVGESYDEALESISARLPNETAIARGTLARFISLRPGDVIALKSHSAPSGKQARLVIARFAVVRGTGKPHYKLLEALGHSIEVDFFAEQEPIELPYGYGQTLHRVDEADRIDAIFGEYGRAASTAAASVQELTDKATHVSSVASRSEYILTRVHNELQNALRNRLVGIFGEQAVEQEKDNIDLSVSQSAVFILFEVKASLSPTSCIREALGQMLHYAWRVRGRHPRVRYVVVGPSNPSQADREFVEHIRKVTKLPLTYCTPVTYENTND